MALLYAISMTLMALLMLPVFSSIPTPEGQNAANQQALFSMLRFMLLIYPVFGLVFGWIIGLLGAFFYNVIARWIGGLNLDFNVHSGQMAGTPAA
jgi:hypothetical protein